MIRLIIENMKKVITKKEPKLAVKKEVKVKEVIPCAVCDGRGLKDRETLCLECEGSGITK